MLMAVRLWFRGGTLRSMAVIHAAFRNAGIPTDALLPLFSALGVFTTGRPLIVLSPAALELGADETALLEALGALQHGDDDAGLTVLDRWLPLAALCMVTASAQEFGRKLAAAGVFLPYDRVRSASLSLAAE